MCKNIKKIVLTGGPCAGKSTALNKIEEKLSQIGYKVLIVPETATEVMTGGIKPQDLGYLPKDFQKTILKYQIEKEKIFEEVAKKMSVDNVVIICDRGSFDGRAYCSHEVFSDLLEELGINEINLRDGYDAVFHLKTAADGAEEFYTLSNNATRKETIEEARILDKKTINAWIGHPYLRVIDNSTDFNAKIKRVVSEIHKFLGEPVPVETARKFLIEMPDIQQLFKELNAQKIDIIQTYLKRDNDDMEKRIRQRGKDGNYIYSLTTKKEIDAVNFIKTDKRLTSREYLTLLMSADSTLKPIVKERYCFVHNNLYFELDIYPFWTDKAILEIKLTTETQEVQLPSLVKVIKEVSEDYEYRNMSLAKAIPIE